MQDFMKLKGFHEVGWGVILPQYLSAEVKYRLAPLLALRRSQAGRLYKELEYRLPESHLDLLRRYGVNPGLIDPAVFPLCILVAGTLEAIPLNLGRGLSSFGYMVDRLSPDGLEDYERLAIEQVEREIYGKFINSHEPLTHSEVRVRVEPLQKEMFRRLADHPQQLYGLEPRKFEEIIATVLTELGCEVELTPATRDGGRDILAFFDGPFGDRLCAIVECKRHRSDRPVSIDLVQRFLWVLEHEDVATCGLIAATSSFSPEARLLEKRYHWRLMLKDLEAVRTWLRRAGDFDYSEDQKLWIPSSLRKPKFGI